MCVFISVNVQTYVHMSARVSDISLLATTVRHLMIFILLLSRNSTSVYSVSCLNAETDTLSSRICWMWGVWQLPHTEGMTYQMYSKHECTNTRVGKNALMHTEKTQAHTDTCSLALLVLCIASTGQHFSNWTGVLNRQKTHPVKTHFITFL